MAFFGVEVKPGKPFSHRFDVERGRLHISQATLGIGSSTKRCLVQCNVGDKSPILLCSLTPAQIESCPLDLEFEEEDEVLFSVLGPQSVHLTGYYLGRGCSHGGDADDTDSYGEDIAETESDNSSYYDTEEDEYDDDFIDDDDDETDPEMYPGGPEMYHSSPKRKSGVVIEEIVDEKPANGLADRKRLKKKYHVSDSDGDNQQQIVVRGSNGVLLSETEDEGEDEDGFPVNSHAKKAEVKEKSDKKGSKKKVDDGSEQAAGSKRKVDAFAQHEDERAIEEQKDSSAQSMEVEHETGEKSKKKKKKQRVKEVENKGAESENRSDGAPKDNAQLEVEKSCSQHETIGNGLEQSNDRSIDTPKDDAKVKKNKKKKKKSKAQDGANVGDVVEADNNSTENKEKKPELKRSSVRSFSNGLVIEELKMGKADGKKASPGSKVSVHYIGKLKKNGKIFDSNIGKAPFKFRLGVGQVIKGWDVGVNGMRIGDKRRITIPPSMGYGTKGAGIIPPNAWLEFDVELVEVR